MKTEPEVFGIDDLERRGREPWDGVRNYQARNYMRDGMKLGDLIFIYHSNCNPPGIAGIARIVREAYPDLSALDPESDYYDPRCKPESPAWVMVDVAFERRTRRLIALDELRECADLADLALVKRGNRLSVMPVAQHEWDAILQLEKRDS